nr:PAS domain S-box protein [Fimbriimonas ginsengisoli]
MEPRLHSEAEAFFELARELMIVRTLEGKLLAINPAIERILGWTPDEATAMDLPALVHPEDRAARLRGIESLLKTGGTTSWDCRCLSKSGEYKWIHWTCTVDLAGDRVYFAGSDLTEVNDLKERLESSRQHAEAEMTHLLTHVRCLLWQAEVWVEGEEFIWQTEIRNPAGAEHFLQIEIPPDCDYSIAFHLAKLDEDTGRMKQTCDAALRNGDSGYQQEFRMRLASGEIRWIFEDVSITPSAAGRWLLNGVCTDVTEQKKANEEMSRVLTTARCLLIQADVRDRDGALVWVSQVRNLEGAQQFFPIHISEGETYGNAFHRAKLRGDSARMNQRSTMALRNGESGYQQEFRVRRMDGEIRWLAEDVHVEHLDEGRWYVTSVCTDITERKLAEEAMSQILTGANCLLWQAQVTDRGEKPFWEMEFHNEAAAQQFLPLTIPEGATYLDAFEASWHPDDTAGMHATSEGAILSGADGYRQEFRVRSSNGEYRWLAEDVTIKSQGDGQWRLTGVCTDITERKESQEEISQVLQSARCLLWQADIFDRDGELEWYTEFRNPGAAQAFLPVDIPPGCSYTQAFDAARLPEEAAQMRLHHASEIPEGKSGYQQEFRIRIASGEIRWLAEDVTIEPLEPGHWRLTGVCTDVTEQKKAQEETSQVLSSAHCLLWQAEVTETATDFDWNLEFRNPEAAQQFLPVEIPNGGSYTDGFYRARPQEHSESINRLSSMALSSGQSGYQQEFSVRTANGDLRWLSEDVHIEQSGEGRWRLTGVCTDITERKRVEDSMSKVQATARCLLWEATVVDLDGFLSWTIGIINPDAAQQLLAMEVMPGGNYTDAFNLAKLPEDLPRMNTVSTAALRSGQDSYQQEYRIKVAGGEIRWLDESVSVEPDGEGQWRLTGVCVDVTERRRAEEEVKLVVNSARCLLWQADVTERDGIFEWGPDLYNPGTPKNELGIQPAADGASEIDADTQVFLGERLPEDAKRMDEVSDRALRTGQSGYRHEYRVRSKEGEIYWISEDVTIEPKGPREWRLTGVCTDITERKRAEIALSESEIRLRAVIESVDEIAFEFDAEGTYVEIWTANEKLLAKPRSELIGQRVAAVLGEEWSRPFIEAFGRVMANLEPESLEYSLDLPDGKHWFLARISPILGSDGSCQTVCLLARDISARKMAEEALRRSEASYQRIVANVPGVVSQLLLHPDGSYQCLYLNAACREMFGREPAEFEQDASLVLATVYSDDRRSFIESFSAAASTLSPWKWEGRYYAKGGEVRWLEAISRPELQPNGDILWDCLLMDATARKNMEAEMKRSQDELQDRFHDRTRDLRHANVALQNEILERKQAQEELKESEMRYRAIVEDQTEMICRFLADGTFTFVNDAHCRYYEALPEDLLGRSFIDFLPPEDATRIRNHLASLGPRNPVGSYEISTLSRDGEIRWQHWTDRCIWDEEGEFVCFQSVGRDITARKKTEEALLLAKEEAERANLAKSEFLSRMSHELRTPLNAILGFGQLLDRNELDEVQKESVQHILKGGRHLLGLINEVLDLARVEAGRTDVSIEPVSVATVVRESLDLVQSLGSEHNVRLDVDVTKFTPYYALADQQRLKQVLINLLSNGIKYNRSGGSVQVDCSTEGDRLRIDVQDTGHGIAAGDLDKLFRPFERLTANNTNVEGTGLGLALSKRLINLMNGELEVQSTVGVGSRFSITLPLSESPEKKLTAIPAEFVEQTPGPMGSYSVLCIEDNLSNLRLVEVLLGSRPGIELLSAMQGNVGLDLARQLKPDLILLDLNLPDMSGKDVMARLRESSDTKEIPIVVISADATPVQIERLLGGGADAYLTKPLDVAAFLATLDRFLK